uniref:NACHT and WD repeat domain containing 1 n=1 Tax=Oryzias melastigma TaxID=30732 RepID=A0A3B3D407_ORYME
MSSERKALLEKAFPEVLLFCRGLGLVFEALLGNRYGHRALPRLIPEKQFEVYLSKLSNTPGGIKQLQQWFRKDTNALPPTYVLQPITAYFPYYCDLRPESEQQHNRDVDSWRLTETQLLQLLRSAASEAEAAGEIPAELKRSFYTSLEQGLWIGGNPANALLFLREQKVKERPKRLAKFMDATANGLLDPEAQKLLTELKSQLSATSQNSLNLHCVELSRGTIDPKRKEHAQYLDILCQQFVSQMKARIEVAVSSRRTGRWKKLWGSAEEDEDKLPLVLEEAKQHSIMSAELCKGLHGREGILGKICLAMWESGQKRHSPLVVHGAAGMGKTALLCKVVQEVQRVLEARVVLVIRFLAACHPQRPDLDQVLHSACLQVSSACGLAPPTPMTASSPTEMQQFFRNILEEASQQGCTLLIVFDALEQLAEQNHTHKLHWVPTNLPPKVHLLVSMDTCSEAFVNMRLKTDSLENFFEVERLSGDEGEHIMESHLRASQRTLTPEQKDVVLQNFTPTGCPLHLKLILSAVQNWTSFTPLTEQLLGANTEEVMSQLLHRLEHKHGKELVGGALGYIALAVPPQPLWFAPGLANIRKLQALPYHLLHAGLWEELRQEVISAEWLFCKSRVCGVSSVIRDLDQGSKYMDCTETGLIRDALALIKPGLDFLDGHVPSLIGRLCSQINDWFLTCPEPALIPKCSFLQQPGGALQHTMLAAGAEDGGVAIWSLEDQQLLHVLLGAVLTVKLESGAPSCLSVSADGSLRRWSLKNGQQLLCIQEAVWSVTTGALLDFFCGSDASVTSLLFFRDFVVSASSTKSAIHLWSLKYDCRLKHPAHIPAGSAHAALTRDGNQIFYIHHQSQREVVRWNSQTLEERLAVSAEVSCLELAQHKRLLLCGLTSGTVLIYPLNLPQETLCIPPPESLSGVLCLAVSSQEKNVAVAYEDSVSLFEMATRDSFPTVEGPLRRFPMSLLHAPLSCMALLADRRLLYGTSCGGVRLQGFSGTISELEPHGSKVTCVTASNWGSHALVGSQDGVQRLWALNPPSLDHTMEHKGFFFHGVISAAFSESDQFVFTGSQDRTIKVWDVASKLLFVQYVYSPVVRMVTFRNGFAALTQQGSVIREAFRCPDHVSPDYNPLRSIRGQYRLTSRDKNRDARRTSVSDLQHFNPAQFKLSLMGPLRAEPSSACVLL